ncbi:MAG: response regulator [Lachnospiraceae bacterium]|nr:response regulator [Lachnospiraceae bacterium]
MINYRRRKGFLNITLFGKNRAKIAERNYVGLMFGGFGVFLVALGVFVLKKFILAMPIHLEFVIYLPVCLLFMMGVRFLYDKHSNIVPIAANVWYVLIFVVVMHIRIVYNYPRDFFIYAVVAGLLALQFIAEPLCLILGQLMGAALYCLGMYIGNGEMLKEVEILQIAVVCLIAVTAGVISSYLRVEGLIFNEEMTSFIDETKGAFVSEYEDVYWEGRNKYSILSGNAIKPRKVFSFVFSVTKRKIEHVRAKNLFSLSEGMAWSEAKERFLSRSIDIGSKRRLEDLLDIEAIERKAYAGVRRFSAMGGFVFSKNDILWFDMELVVKIHPVSGEIIGTMLMEDVTEERIMMGVLHRIVENSCDFDCCYVKDSDYSIFFRVDDTKELRAELNASYPQITETYARTKLAPETAEEYLKKAEIGNVIKELDENGLLDIYVDEIAPAGSIRKKLFQYSYMGPSGLFINILKQDITEMVSREEKINRALEQALSEKDKAMSVQKDFLTRMSHEIRTPMNAILGLSAMLEDDSADKKTMFENIQKIRYSGQFLLSLVNDVLDMSKIEQNKFNIKSESVTFTDLLKAVDMMIVPMCTKKGIRYDCDFELPKDTAVLGDRMRLTQIFVNLLSNAVKYTPAGGSIRFEGRTVSETGAKVDCVFKVIDDGIGMSEEFQKHLFEPFSQESRVVNPEFSGTGLGLAIVKGIVEAFGGSIKVESEQNKGSTFEVSLSFNKLEPSYTEEEVIVESDFSGKCFLVVEDNEINRDIAVALLERKKAIVETASNGEEAVVMFMSSAAFKYDAILMDIRMPVMDGEKAADHIRKSGRADAESVLIVAMTANVPAFDSTEPESSVFDRFLPKPVDPKILYKVLEDGLSKIN